MTFLFFENCILTLPLASGIFKRICNGISLLSDYVIDVKVGEGTFGEVHRAKQIRTGRLVALKKVLLRSEQEGFPITALREIKLLKSVRHPNVIELLDICVEYKEPSMQVPSSIFMVFPYMDHDLTALLEAPEIRFSCGQIKCYMKQLLKGLAYLHDQGMLHRDMKGANLLINNRGELRITDFGLARWTNSHGNYTPGVVTRWYRPPELLLGSTNYTQSVDIWGAGCILAEMFMKKPLLPGDSDIHQLELVSRLCGTPSAAVFGELPDWPKTSFPQCRRRVKEVLSERISDKFALDLIDAMLALDPSERPTAKAALEHSFFTQPPAIALPQSLPIYPSKHAIKDEQGIGAKRTPNDRHLHPPHPTPRQHGHHSDDQRGHYSNNPVQTSFRKEPNRSHLEPSTAEYHHRYNQHHHDNIRSLLPYGRQPYIGHHHYNSHYNNNQRADAYYHYRRDAEIDYGYKSDESYRYNGPTTSARPRSRSPSPRERRKEEYEPYYGHSNPPPPPWRTRDAYRPNRNSRDGSGH